METKVPMAKRVVETLYALRLNLTASADVGMTLGAVRPKPSSPESFRKDLRLRAPFGLKLLSFPSILSFRHKFLGVFHNKKSRIPPAV